MNSAQSICFASSCEDADHITASSLSMTIDCVLRLQAVLSQMQKSAMNSCMKSIVLHPLQARLAQLQSLRQLGGLLPPCHLGACRSANARFYLSGSASAVIAPPRAMSYTVSEANTCITSFVICLEAFSSTHKWRLALGCCHTVMIIRLYTAQQACLLLSMTDRPSLS